MKKIVLFLITVFVYIKTVFALPVGILVLGYDFFILFFGILSSLFVTLFLYFKSLNIKIKIGILLLFTLLFFPLKYFYIEYNKKIFLEEYTKNIQNIEVDEFYKGTNKYNELNDKNIDLNKFAKPIKIKEIDKDLDRYIIINILENGMGDSFDMKDSYKNLDIKQIRPVELFKNFEEIKKENGNKEIIVTCITGYRSSIISGFLNKKGYNTYYIEGGMKELGTATFRKKRSFSYCKDKNYDKKTVVNIGYEAEDKYNALLSIPYLDLTDNEFKLNIQKILDNNLISKDESIVLSCDMDFMDNCSLGRQGVNGILKDMGFKDVCLSMGVAF